MNLKSLKKYKVPLLIFAIVLLSLILIVTLMKSNNKESFDPGDEGHGDDLHTIMHKMKDADGNEVVGDRQNDQKMNDNILKHSMLSSNTKALITVSNDDDTMDIAAYTELPTNFDEICQENNSGDIIEVNPDILVTDLNELKANLVGVWVGGSDDPYAKIYLEVYQVDETYSSILMNIKDNGEINDVYPPSAFFTISINQDNHNILKFDADGNMIELLSMANNEGVYTLIGDALLTKCNSGQCFKPRELIELNKYLHNTETSRTFTSDEEQLLFQPKVTSDKLNNGVLTWNSETSAENQDYESETAAENHDYEIDFYKTDKTKLVLSFNSEKYVIKKNDYGLETQALNELGVPGTIKNWTLNT